MQGLLIASGVYCSQAQEKDVTGVNCCSEIRVEGGQASVDNQWTRLGVYRLTGEEGGRAVYTQDNGQNYIYFLGSWIPGYDWWYINGILGENMGGMLNHDKTVNCPDQITMVWDVYVWTGEWASINDWYPDPELTITCTNGETTAPPFPTTTTTRPPPPTTTSGDREVCTWGSWCDGCDVTASSNGETYCCANECNTGGIHIDVGANGNVDCFCYH